jgi:hypothetical protein
MCITYKALNTGQQPFEKLFLPLPSRPRLFPGRDTDNAPPARVEIQGALHLLPQTLAPNCVSFQAICRSDPGRFLLGSAHFFGT